MKHNNVGVWVIAVLVAIIIISCSESSTNPPNNNTVTVLKNFFPNNTGSWWIYESYKINDENEKIVESVKIDSTLLTGTELKAEKIADVYKTFNELGEQIAIQHFYKEDSTKLFIHSDYINFIISKNIEVLPIELPFKIGATWMKLVDFNLQSWKVFDTTFTNFVLTEQVTVDGKFSVTCEKGIQSYISVGGVMIKSQDFIMTFQFKGFLSIDPQSEKTMTLKIHNWFGENAGLLKYTFENSNFDFGIGTYYFQGNESKAIRYLLK